MTPKEKAQELINSFSFIQYGVDDSEKLCAKIVSEEIVSVLGEGGVNGSADPYVLMFWESVDEEITKQLG